MSFLQPWLLVALPLAALPVIIHLINQRRFQTIDWAAMRFLLEANRMSRGYARIRQWLILLFRVLAIAALVFMISRPLATGWLGLAGGGRPDTTLILIDRSPSMMQHGGGNVRSKLETGVALVAQTLATLGSSRWVVIDSVSQEPRELKSPAELLESPAAQPASASADLPALLQAAHDYIKNNRAGQTEVWICSDLRANDWNAESGRWERLRDSFQEFKQSVRFHLLAYSAPAADNVAVRVTDVERRTIGDEAALFLSLRLTRDGDTGKRSVPMQFEIEGARSELTVDMEGRELDLKNHRIPLAADRAARLGPGVDSSRREPGGQRVLFRLRRAAVAPHDSGDRRPRGHAALGAGSRQLARSSGHHQRRCHRPGSIGRRCVGRRRTGALASAVAGEHCRGRHRAIREPRWASCILSTQRTRQ